MKLFESRIGPSVFKSYYEHAEKVFETVENMNACVKAACEGKDIQGLITATSESELEADKIKSEMRDVLRGSVRLAVDKPVFLDLVSRQDRIADYAENVTEILSFRKLYENKEAKALVLELADAVNRRRIQKTVGASNIFLNLHFPIKKKTLCINILAMLMI